jgi:hypothetical protein
MGRARSRWTGALLWLLTAAACGVLGAWLFGGRRADPAPAPLEDAPSPRAPAGAAFVALPGPARLEWSGTNLEAGHLGDLVLDAPLGGEVRATLRYAGPPPPEPLTVRVVLPEGLDPEVDDSPRVVAAVSYPGETLAEEFECDADGVARLPGRVRGGGPILAQAGERWASRPFVPPATGDATLVLERAGCLLLVLEAPPPPDLGPFRARHADGLPLVKEEEGDYEMGVDGLAAGRAGTLRLVGLPPGEHRLDLSLGRHALGSVSAVVRAGKTTVLPLRD